MYDAEKQIALCQKLGASASLVFVGLRELNLDGAARGFFHLPIQLVHKGLDDFIETIISTHHLEATGDVPNKIEVSATAKQQPVRTLRKAISRLTEERICHDERLQSDIAKAELEFLLTDKRPQLLVDILCRYEMGAHYYNLNLIYGVDPPGICQAVELEELRQEIWEDMLHRDGEPESRQDYEIVDRELCFTITSACELVMRSLCRLCTRRSLSMYRDELSVYTDHFRLMTEDNLGMTDYAELDTILQEQSVLGISRRRRSHTDMFPMSTPVPAIVAAR